MRVLVTGASGFIGTPTCVSLMQRGIQVRAAVRGDKPLPDGIELAYISEVGPDTDWRKALCGVDVVVHLAARAHILRDNAKDALTNFRRTNVQGTLVLAQQAVQAGVQRIVFISSIGVNGVMTTQTPFTPEIIPSPRSPYAQSKHEAEQGLLRLAAESGLEVVIIRPPLVYGPNAPGNFGTLLRWVQRGFPLPFGAVCNKRSLVALDNLVSFIALCADRNRSMSAANEVFLISDGEDVSTPELMRKIARACDKTARLVSVPPTLLYLGARLVGKSAMADSLLASLVVDSSKCQSLLGWQPLISMDEQLRKIAWVDRQS